MQTMQCHAILYNSTSLKKCNFIVICLLCFRKWSYVTGGEGSLSCICLLCFYLNLFCGGNGGLGGGFFLFDILVLSFVFVFVLFFSSQIGWLYLSSCCICLLYFYLKLVGRGCVPGDRGVGIGFSCIRCLPTAPPATHCSPSTCFQNTQKIHKKYTKNTQTRKKRKVWKKTPLSFVFWAFAVYVQLHWIFVIITVFITFKMI